MSASTSTISSDTTTTNTTNAVMRDNKSEEEIKRLNDCVGELRKENIELTSELQRSLEQETKMMENILRLEAQVELYKEKLAHQKEIGYVYLSQFYNYIDLFPNHSLLTYKSFVIIYLLLQ